MVQDSWRLINHNQDESFVNKTKGMHVKKNTDFEGGQQSNISL